ncbi:hypothetical protein [Terribacillus saccharophilus]|uniref:hypothetical protein n=1 Tax=Terribacillus saccharophilus TaxID=361277 RepID=UPI002DC68236|nr:hypothetical protein [Terribacillus saccharophilus]MEC0289898.1 hypothetical protein [Terribacillus saccharophilus]
MRKTRVFAITCFICFTLIGGCLAIRGDNSYDEETIVKAEAAAKSYVENNFRNIESVELEEPYQSPMGSMKVDGTVNDGQSGFSISLNNDFTVGSISLGEGFLERFEECSKKSCDY